MSSIAAERVMTPEPTLRHYLSIPYRIEAETVEVEQGTWLRRATYPELLGCMAEAATIEEALERLERRRVDIIVALLHGGAAPPAPRPPLADCDPEGLMHRLGLHTALAPLLDRTGARMHGDASPVPLT
jgi:hypothetical protein